MGEKDTRSVFNFGKWKNETSKKEEKEGVVVSEKKGQNRFT